MNLNILGLGTRVFPCAQCGEEVNTSLKACPYCQAALDAKMAAIAADIQSQLSSALSDSRRIRRIGGTALALGLVPFPAYASWGTMTFLKYYWVSVWFMAALAACMAGLTAVLALRWRGRFGRLGFEQVGKKPALRMQQDYGGAKQAIVQGLALSALGTAIGFVHGYILHGFSSFLR
jgi:hypothetical protein